MWEVDDLVHLERLPAFDECFSAVTASKVREALARRAASRASAAVIALTPGTPSSVASAALPEAALARPQPGCALLAGAVQCSLDPAAPQLSVAPPAPSLPCRTAAAAVLQAAARRYLARGTLLHSVYAAGWIQRAARRQLARSAASSLRLLQGLRDEEAPLRWRRELTQGRRLRAGAMRLVSSLGRVERKRDDGDVWGRHCFLVRLSHYASRDMAQCSFFGYADGCARHGVPNMVGGTADGKPSTSASSSGTPPTSVPAPPSGGPTSTAAASRKSAKRSARRGRAHSSAAAPAADSTSTCFVAGGTTNGDISTAYPTSGTPPTVHSEAEMAAVLRCRECVAAVPGAVWTMAGRCDSCRYVAPQREVRAMLRWECLLDALPLLVDYDRQGVLCARCLRRPWP